MSIEKIGKRTLIMAKTTMFLDFVGNTKMGATESTVSALRLAARLVELDFKELTEDIIMRELEFFEQDSNGRS